MKILDTLRRKLQSRKLWFAIVAFISGCVLCYGDYGVIGITAGGFLQTAATVSYIISEASVDVSSVENNKADK